MVNAIQAMPDGGMLTLAAEDWDEADMAVSLRLMVADSCPEISAADRERLFKPFFTAGKPGGTGLGLWVSQSLVKGYVRPGPFHGLAALRAAGPLTCLCKFSHSGRYADVALRC